MSESVSVATLADSWVLRPLGTGGYPSWPNRGMPATLMLLGGRRLLINCGDGTLVQMLRFDSERPIESIFLTSCNNEYSNGVVTLVEWAQRRLRTSPPVIYGPPGLREWASAISRIADDEWFEAQFREVSDGAEIGVGPYSVRVRVLGESGGGTHIGYRFQEPTLPGNVDLEKARAVGLDEGPQLGLLQQGQTVAGIKPEDVLGPSRPGRTVAFTAGGRPSEAMCELAEDVDLLFAAGTYIDERLLVAKRTGYSTGAEAARVASSAGARALALSRLGRNVIPSYARAEAQQFHKPIYVPEDGSRFNFPVPGKGSLAYVSSVSRPRSGRRRPKKASPTQTAAKEPS